MRIRKSWLIGIVAALAILLLVPVVASANSIDKTSAKLKNDNLKVKAFVGDLDLNNTYSVVLTADQGSTRVLNVSATVSAANLTYDDGNFNVELASKGRLRIRYRGPVDGSQSTAVALTVRSGRTTLASGNASVDPNNRKEKFRW